LLFCLKQVVQRPKVVAGIVAVVSAIVGIVVVCGVIAVVVVCIVIVAIVAVVMTLVWIATSVYCSAASAIKHYAKRNQYACCWRNSVFFVKHGI